MTKDSYIVGYAIHDGIPVENGEYESCMAFSEEQAKTAIKNGICTSCGLWVGLNDNSNDQ